MNKHIRNFQWAIDNDSIVRSVVESGGDATDCVVTLVKQKEGLLKRIMRLEGICPRKVILPGNEVLIWRCPDEFVPVNDHVVEIPETQNGAEKKEKPTLKELEETNNIAGQGLTLETILEAEKLIKDIKDPLAEYMKEKGYDPEKGDMLAWPESMSKVFGKKIPPPYVRIVKDKYLKVPCMIKGLII